jgi:hypothetical protein
VTIQPLAFSTASINPATGLFHRINIYRINEVIMSHSKSSPSLSTPETDPNTAPYTNPNPKPFEDPNTGPYTNPDPEPMEDPNTDPYTNPHPREYEDPNVDPYTNPDVLNNPEEQE